MTKNYSGILKYQPQFPDKPIMDVVQSIGGYVEIWFEDGGNLKYSPVDYSPIDTEWNKEDSHE
jgi:hypothetical protein